MASTKFVRIKINTIEWFDGEIAKRKIAARDKPFRKLKNSKLTLDEILHKKSKKYRASFN